jgi:hypothetical protein
VREGVGWSDERREEVSEGTEEAAGEMAGVEAEDSVGGGWSDGPDPEGDWGEGAAGILDRERLARGFAGEESEIAQNGGEERRERKWSAASGSCRTSRQ